MTLFTVFFSVLYFSPSVSLANLFLLLLYKGLRINHSMHRCDTFYSLFFCSLFFTFCLLSQPFFVVAVQRFMAKCPDVTLLTVLCSLFFTFCLLIHPLSPHPSFSSQTSTASPQQTGVKVRMLIYGPEHFNIVAPKYPTTVYHQAVFENFKHSPLLFRFWGCFFVCFVLFWQVITHMQFRFWQFICLFVLFWQVITHMFKSSAQQHFQAQKLRTKQNALI